jgi:hypothetical protein
MGPYTKHTSTHNDLQTRCLLTTAIAFEKRCRISIKLERVLENVPMELQFEVTIPIENSLTISCVIIIIIVIKLLLLEQYAVA